MAEDIRNGHAEIRVNEIKSECYRQYESCVYTASNMYIWMKWAQAGRAAFIIIPIIIGGLASSQVLINWFSDDHHVVASFLALVAGFFPAIYVSLGLDMRINEIKRSAAEFTSLRDRFRQAEKITSLKSVEEFEAEFQALMDRMDAIRASAPPAPEWCFRETQKKVKRGDYTSAIDEKQQEQRVRSIWPFGRD